MENKNICIVPGVFDPVTVGHVDVIIRAAELFDKIYVASFRNSSKNTMFTLEERHEMLNLACDGTDKDKVIVDATDELLADYAKLKGARYIVKGVRNVVDYEYEYDLYMINREIGNGIETLFFPAKPEHLYISSTFVREMIRYGRDISNYVPEKVAGYIKKITKNKASDN